VLGETAIIGIMVKAGLYGIKLKYKNCKRVGAMAPVVCTLVPGGTPPKVVLNVITRRRTIKESFEDQRDFYKEQLSEIGINPDELFANKENSNGKVSKNVQKFIMKEG